MWAPLTSIDASSSSLPIVEDNYFYNLKKDPAPRKNTSSSTLNVKPYCSFNFSFCFQLPSFTFTLVSASATIGSGYPRHLLERWLMGPLFKIFQCTF